MKHYLINFAKTFPITFGVIVFNLLIFGVNHLYLGLPIVSFPKIFGLESFLAHFSHWDWWHIAMNMVIFYQISPLIEKKFPKITYIFIILAIWFLLVPSIYFFSASPTLGFSGIGLGLMTFCGILYWHNKIFAKQILGWVMINILIGFLPSISLAGHLLGAVSGLLVFLFIKIIYQKNH